jgi:anti-sigma-K factor RskA
MTEELQDQASLYALNLLDAKEARAFEKEMSENAELRVLVEDLRNAAAEMARLAPTITPRAEVKARLMDEIARRTGSKTTAPTARKSGFMPKLGWAIAAALAVASVWLWSERERLDSEVTSLAEAEGTVRNQLGLELQRERDNVALLESSTRLRVEAMQRQIDHYKGEAGRALANVTALDNLVAQLQQRNALAKVQIATLQSDVAAYKKGVAVVVWDSEKNQGVLKLEKMPPVEPGKDYQLWVVDPQKPAPVDAGVVRVDEKGFAKIDFKPVDAIATAEKFALSVEKEGGVPKGEGPIVLIGP